MSAECSTKEKIHTYKNVSLRFQVVLELSSNILPLLFWIVYPKG